MYIGIALKWDHEKGTVQLSMLGCVRAALHSFQHEKTKDPINHHNPMQNPSIKEQSDAIREITS